MSARVAVLLLWCLPLGAAAPKPALVLVQQAPQAGDSRIVRLDPDGRVQVLTAEFAAAADPCVAFDGQRVLFAGRQRAGDAWQIWEMGADGGGKRQLTSGLGECREPIYLAQAAVDAPVFEQKVRWFCFTSTAPGVLDEEGRGPLRSLYAQSMEPVPGRGIVTWRATYGLGGDAAPTILADGRVLFSAWQREGLALMSISWAGEDLNAFYGTHDGDLSQSEACELPDRTVVFVEHHRPDAHQGGQLARVDLRRPLATHQALSRPGEEYRSPQPAPDGGLLVAHRPAGKTWGIYRFAPTKSRLGPKVLDDPAWDEYDAQVLAPRPEPVGRIPMVEFASVLDVGELKGLGQLQCLNVYDSDRPDRAEAGRVTRVRLVEGVPLLPGEAPARPPGGWPPAYVRTRLLGEAPVEPDGSFYVNVAGDVPFYMETLDAGGQVVQTMRAWTWVRSGDQRGCVGCHENKELAPENRATQALIRALPVTLKGEGR
ncbi:MAG: hypothetical protein IT369_18410 [Candidatus Latescibacteria bacterium]|nr:hypothetical protein [Candidatus Latescibacterota bacterium]